MRTLVRLVILEITGDQGRQVEPEQLTESGREQILCECDILRAHLEELRGQEQR